MSSLLQQTGLSCGRKDEVRRAAISKDIVTCSNNSPSAAIDLDLYELNNENNPAVWIPELHLTEVDRNILLRPQSWLSGAIINAAQELRGRGIL